MAHKQRPPEIVAALRAGDTLSCAPPNQRSTTEGGASCQRWVWFCSGGALGAYEYGAVTRLVELGWHPVAVTGVSIGAATAGAPDADICKSLKRLWEAITLDPVPF